MGRLKIVLRTPGLPGQFFWQNIHFRLHKHLHCFWRKELRQKTSEKLAVRLDWISFSFFFFSQCCKKNWVIFGEIDIFYSEHELCWAKERSLALSSMLGIRECLKLNNINVTSAFTPHMSLIDSLTLKRPLKWFRWGAIVVVCWGIQGTSPTENVSKRKRVKERKTGRQRKRQKHRDKDRQRWRLQEEKKKRKKAKKW